MVDNPYDPQAYRDFEQAAWSRLPESYYEHFGFLTAQATEPLLNAVGATKGVRLLDVACGTGHVSAAAMARGAIPIGIDFVAGMVTEARTRHPGIEFREGDAEALPFGDESFDAVVCNFGVHHFGRLEQAMAEAFRVLAAGGRYAFTVWLPPDEVKVNLRQVVRTAIETHGNPHGSLPTAPAEFSNLEESRQALLAIGFVDVTATELPIVGSWSKPDHVLETIYKGMGRTKALMEAQSDEARQKIESAVLEGTKRFDKDGTIQIPMPAMLACGRKP